MWTVVYSKQAVKDSKKIEQSNLKESVLKLLEVIKKDHFEIVKFEVRLCADLKLITMKQRASFCVKAADSPEQKMQKELHGQKLPLHPVSQFWCKCLHQSP